MAGTGQVSMLQMSPSLPELLAQTRRWLQRGPSDARCPALHGGKCPKSALDPKVSDLGESAQNLALTAKSASWGPAGWAPQMILDQAFPGAWHSCGMAQGAATQPMSLLGFLAAKCWLPAAPSRDRGWGRGVAPLVLWALPGSASLVPSWALCAPALAWVALVPYPVHPCGMSAPHTPKPAAPQGWRGCRAGTGMWAAAGCWGPLQGESPPGLPQPPGFCRARPPAGSPWPVKRTRGKRSQRCQMQIASRVTHPDNGVQLILLQWD